LLVSRALFKRNGKLENFGGSSRGNSASQLQEQVVDSRGESKPSFKKEVDKSLQEEPVVCHTVALPFTF
jgi:hypothetical protein